MESKTRQAELRLNDFEQRVYQLQETKTMQRQHILSYSLPLKWTPTLVTTIDYYCCSFAGPNKVSSSLGWACADQSYVAILVTSK